MSYRPGDTVIYHGKRLTLQPKQPKRACAPTPAPAAPKGARQATSTTTPTARQKAELWRVADGVAVDMSGIPETDREALWGRFCACFGRVWRAIRGRERGLLLEEFKTRPLRLMETTSAGLGVAGCVASNAVEFSRAPLERQSDGFVSFVLAHEFGHLLGLRDGDRSEGTADGWARRWGFVRE